MQGISVEFVDKMGSDISVSNSARVSFGKWKEDFDEKDAKLIDFLAREDHMTPFRHNAIQIRCKAPIFIARQLGKHQAGLCLHEDTDVTIISHYKGSSNTKNTVKIKDLYRMWSGQIKYQGGRKGIMNVQKHRVRVYNEETLRFETSTILDVIDSGVKEVFQVMDEAGNVVAASKDHDFLTTDGWKKLKDLKIGDYLIRDDIGEPFGYSKPLPRGLDKATRNKFRATGDCCAKCGSKENLEVDHVISVAQDISLANSMGNLQILCKSCHNEKSASERQSKTTLLPKMIPIVDIRSIGEVQTYDLTIDKIHNFLANGFVVHNSWNEISRRYVDTKPEFFVPEVWRSRPEGGIKQGSGYDFSEHEQFNLDYDQIYCEWDTGNIKEAYEWFVDNCVDFYEQMLSKGVAPEMARMILPQSMLTEWVWTGNLLAFAHVYKLRIGEHAQVEAQAFAKELDKVCREHFPVAWSALVD